MLLLLLLLLLPLLLFQLLLLLLLLGQDHRQVVGIDQRPSRLVVVVVADRTLRTHVSSSPSSPRPRPDSRPRSPPYSSALLRPGRDGPSLPGHVAEFQSLIDLLGGGQPESAGSVLEQAGVDAVLECAPNLPDHVPRLRGHFGEADGGLDLVGDAPERGAVLHVREGVQHAGKQLRVLRSARSL